MSKSLLILTPDPDTPSYGGRWPYVLDNLRQSLQGLGLEMSDQPWSAPLDQDYDLIVPLIAWGYHYKPQAFAEALRAMEARGRLLNPASVLIWNLDKTYLKDLADAGIRIIPTLFVNPLTQEAIDQARQDFGQQALVLKPVFSAGAKDTIIWDQEGFPTPQRLKGKRIDPGPKTPTVTPPTSPDLFKDEDGIWVEAPRGAAMIQPFMSAIQTEGEWSLLYFGGQMSHCVLKTPKSGDFRSQPDYDAHLRPLDPPQDILALAEQVMDYLGRDQILYARVDMTRDAQSQPCLMELELIEPDFYLNHVPEAAMKLLDAFEAALDQKDPSSI